MCINVGNVKMGKSGRFPGALVVAGRVPGGRRLSVPHPRPRSASRPLRRRLTVNSLARARRRDAPTPHAGTPRYTHIVLGIGVGHLRRAPLPLRWWRPQGFGQCPARVAGAFPTLVLCWVSVLCLWPGFGYAFQSDVWVSLRVVLCVKIRGGSSSGNFRFARVFNVLYIFAFGSGTEKENRYHNSR